MTVGNSAVISTLPVAVQRTTTDQRALLRLKADSGNTNLLQELKVETPNSERGQESHSQNLVIQTYKGLLDGIIWLAERLMLLGSLLRRCW